MCILTIPASSIGTASFETATAGETFHACFLSSQGVALHMVTAIILEDEVKLVCQPKQGESVLKHINKYIFPLDKIIAIADTSTSVATIAMLHEDRTVTDSIVNRLIKLGDSSHGSSTGAPSDGRMWSRSSIYNYGNRALLVPGGGFTSIHNAQREQSLSASSPSSSSMPVSDMINGLSIVYTASDEGIVAELLHAESIDVVTPGSTTESALLWQLLVKNVGVPMLEVYVDKVKTTALELGLMHSISFNKGCFAGQEVVSKTVTTNAVRRRLCSLVVSPTDSGSNSIAVGDVVFDANGDEVGVIVNTPVVIDENDVMYRSHSLLQKQYVHNSVRFNALIKTKIATCAVSSSLAIISDDSKSRSNGSDSKVKVMSIESLPYSRYDEFLSSQAAPVVTKVIVDKNKQVIGLRSVTSNDDADNAVAIEERRKQEKLRLMQEKLNKRLNR